MSQGSPIELVIVLRSNVIVARGIPASLAQTILHDWCRAITNVAQKGKEWQADKDWLGNGLIMHADVGEQTKNLKDIYMAVRTSEVVGMYIRPCAPSAQDRIADAIEKQANDGDEWKQGE